MTDLRTEYLGMRLKNPLVPSASPLSKELDTAKQLEDAGASALVMYSLFEEEIAQAEEASARFIHEQAVGFGEAESFFPIPDDYLSELDDYLEQIQRLKRSLAIPVIASLNGISLDGWVRHGKELEQAGADGLELNAYYIPTEVEDSSLLVENRYVELLEELRSTVDLPITLKLSSQFTALPHFINRLSEHGASGVALFNRFYQPDIDLDTLDVVPNLQLSTPYEARLRFNWVAMLYGQVDLSLAVTGGIHTAEDIIKSILVGADVTHLCSVLLQQGPNYLGTLLKQVEAWMEEREYESVKQMKGSVSRLHARHPPAFERVNYMRVLDSYQSAPGVRR